MSPTEQDADYWRERLLAELKAARRLRSPSIEAAMRALPRHAFAPEMSFEQAYQNQSLPVTDPRGEVVSSLSQPQMVVTMLEVLALEPGMRVLEIGAGSGYNAALMSYLVGPTGQVVAIDIHPWLIEGARTRLAYFGIDNVRLVCGDGGLGDMSGAPYDRIIATTGTWEVFPAWFEQLAPAGRLHVPLQFGGEARDCLVVDLGWEDDHLSGYVAVPAVFIPMTGDVGGSRGEEQVRAGSAWQPSSSERIVRVMVYRKDADIEPGVNAKLFERRFCKVVLELETN